jgi:hypothetical protein
MALILAAEFSNPFEAEIAHGRLEAEGVENVLFDLGLHGIGIPPKVRLMVADKDLVRARRILAECQEDRR